MTGTCITGTEPANAFGTGNPPSAITQSSCTGAAFPAVYADVSSGSPLCNGSPRICTLSANPVPGFRYLITVAAVDAKPTGEPTSPSTGYGTGFPTTATMLAVGSNPGPLPAATGSPAPTPTPTNLGQIINPGSSNTVSIFLNAIATQFVRIDPCTGFAGGCSASLAVPPDGRVLVEPANGNYTNLPLVFGAGDFDNQLIAGPLSCESTYGGEVGSGPGATIISANFPPTTANSTQCDQFAGPDGKLYAFQLTSSLPTHLFIAAPTVCPTAPPLGTPPPCLAPTFASATTYEGGDYSNLFQEGGVWTQEAPGALQANQGFTWDGTAASDTCTAPFTPTTKCGVPIPILMTNNIATTATPIIGKTTSYNVTNSVQFLLAPFVVTISCGTTPGCSTTNTPPGCTTVCPTVYLDGGGSATVTAYLYASGGESNFPSGGCYGTPATAPCLAVATSNMSNVSSCYSGMNYNTGLLTTGNSTAGQVGCVDTPDTAGAPSATNTQPISNAVDCEAEPTGTIWGSFPTPPVYPVAAYIIPGTFTKGSITTGSLQADSMTFTIKASGPNAGFPGVNGYCNFQVTQANTAVGLNSYLPGGANWLAFAPAIPFELPNHYSPAISVAVSQNGVNLGVPPTNPFP